VKTIRTRPGRVLRQDVNQDGTPEILLTSTPVTVSDADAVSLAALAAASGVEVIVEDTTTGPATPVDLPATQSYVQAQLAAITTGTGTSTSPDTHPSPAVGARFAGPQTIITALQTGHGYATNAGGTANLNNTTDYVLGTQSVSLTTDGLGTAKTLKRVAQPVMNLTGRYVRLWVKVLDQTRVAALQVYLGDTNLANFWRWELKSSAGQKWVTDGDWHVITLSFGDAAVTGTPARTAVTDVQFRVVDDATGPVTVYLNGLAHAPLSTAWPNGVVSFTFDDTYASHYTQARPRMDAYGFPGTAYVIQEYVNGSGRMSMAQLHALERFSGWEVAGHSTTGATHAARFSTMNAGQLETEFSTIRSWLHDNGFAGDHLAYPGGEFSNLALDAAERFFTGARTTYQRSETLPPARSSKIRCGGYVTSATTVAAMTAAVDQAYANGEWLVCAWHDIVTTVGPTTDWLVSDFGTFVSYVASKGIPVRTVGDVLRVRP
jgi:peptidoglycan/xylan/chitin deacetylase (PgdA/CDA1 family)